MECERESWEGTPFHFFFWGKEQEAESFKLNLPFDFHPQNPLPSRATHSTVHGPSVLSCALLW